MKAPKRLICHRCSRNTPAKHYLVYVANYGYVCPECGYTKLNPPSDEVSEEGSEEEST